MGIFFGIYYLGVFEYKYGLFLGVIVFEGVGFL